MGRTLAVRSVPMLVIPRRREGVKWVPFVGTANTCRGQIAQAIFDTLAEDEGLCFRAESAGAEALEGTVMAEYAAAAPEEAGIYPGLYSAR
jgi:protein-tyrosine-phosphatase